MLGRGTDHVVDDARPMIWRYARIVADSFDGTSCVANLIHCLYYSSGH